MLNLIIFAKSILLGKVTHSQVLGIKDIDVFGEPLLCHSMLENRSWGEDYVRTVVLRCRNLGQQDEGRGKQSCRLQNNARW